MEFASLSRRTIAEVFGQHLAPVMAAVLDRAEHTGMSPREIAERTAQRGHRRIRHRVARPGIAGRIMGAGLSLYRRGPIPSAVMRALSPGHFRRLLAAIRQGILAED